MQYVFVIFLNLGGPLNLLLVRSNQAEIIIVKRRIQRRNNVSWVQVKPQSCNQDCRKNDAFTLLGTQNQVVHAKKDLCYDTTDISVTTGLCLRGVKLPEGLKFDGS